MAMLPVAITADEEAPDYTLIPKGWYSVEITSATLTPTKNGTGQFLSVCFKITGISHIGRLVWHNFNIVNNSEKAEAIGRQQLQKMIATVGIKTLLDSDDLIGHDLDVEIVVKSSPGYDDKNEIKKFSVFGAMVKVSGALPAITSPVISAAPAATSALPPWTAPK